MNSPTKSIKTEVISTRLLIKWLRLTAEVMLENKYYLSDLDSPIGDADHGINMDRGFSKVLSRLEKLESEDHSTIMKDTGMALVSSVGGAAGPLYGSFFIQAGNSLAGKTNVNTEDLYECLLQGLAGVKSRGLATIGEKTMVDAMEPAIIAMKHSLQKGKSTTEALGHAVLAAESGMLATTAMLAKKGRASYLGERSIGHQDPGATSTYFLIRALYEAAQSEMS